MKNDYKNYVPKIGDERYSKFIYKSSLDIIRVEYYNKYCKDLSITEKEFAPIFCDPSLQIWATPYYFRGKFHFEVYLARDYEYGKPDYSNTITVKIDEKNINDESLSFSSNLINILTGKEPNLIVGIYEPSKYVYTISYISENYISSGNKSLGYYDFFARLCDNNYRNIIYIGSDFTDDVDPNQINSVNNEFVNPGQAIFADNFNMSVKELETLNNNIACKVLVKRWL